MIRNTAQLGRWLMREVHGIDLPRRSPRKGRRGPYRCWRYRAWVKSLPSAVSDQLGCDPAHTGRGHGMRQKASDLTVIPLTRAEHEEYHRIGRDAFAALHGLDIDALVERLNALWFRGKRLPC